jgi:cytochrome P450
VSGTNAIVTTHRKEKVDAEPNIIHQMLDSPDPPSEDKAAWRLAFELRTFVGAGTETTGNTLSVTAFHLLANPDKAERLKDEIQEVQRSQGTLRYQDLQKLPYLISDF